MSEYDKWLQQKTQLGSMDGFEPLWMPDFLYDFQKHLVEWAIRKGRSAIFADCGLGKTPMQLVYAASERRKSPLRGVVMFEIEKNVPLPASLYLKKSPFPFDKMAVGDSFLLAEGYTRSILSLHVRRYMSLHPETKFITRSIGEEIRCWRIR